MAKRSLVRKVQDFDLYASVKRTVVGFADVPPQSSLVTAVKAVVTNPRKLLIVVGVVGGFSAAVIGLLVSGVLGAVYRSIYEFFPGRPWTHVMRDYPWIFLILAVLLVWLPFTLSPPNRWGRAFLSYVVFWVGFLGGHVFW